LKQTAEDEQRAGGERHEDPSGVDPEIQAERGARIVDERQPDVVAEYLVRYVLRRQVSRSQQLCCQIKRNDEYQRSPKKGRIRLGAFHLLRAACTQCSIWRAAVRRGVRS
jgi:hypothetical protein